MARYTYDAWGMVLKVTNASGTVISSSTNIAIINPFRYRGYYYDTETCLYYLQSRYYDPDAGRFINADDANIVTDEELNLYTYCKNNPCSRVDPLGTISVVLVWLLVVAFVNIATLSHILNVKIAKKNHDWNKKHDTKKIVSDQSKINMKFGLSSVAKMGCGAVALHNALIVAGKSSKLSDVVKYVTTRDLTFGFAGAYFWNLVKYLKKKKYKPSNILFIKKNIDKAIKNSKHKIGILSYQHSKGGHYIAICYQRVARKSRMFRLYNYKGGNYDKNSVDAEVKNKKYKPLCLITF